MAACRAGRDSRAAENPPGLLPLRVSTRWHHHWAWRQSRVTGRGEASARNPRERFLAGLALCRGLQLGPTIRLGSPGSSPSHDGRVSLHAIRGTITLPYLLPAPSSPPFRDGVFSQSPTPVLLEKPRDPSDFAPRFHSWIVCGIAGRRRKKTEANACAPLVSPSFLCLVGGALPLRHFSFWILPEGKKAAKPPPLRNPSASPQSPRPPPPFDLASRAPQQQQPW